jgi:hypothetical protein
VASSCVRRTGLDGSVSLTAATEAERLVVIGITGVHRPPGTGRLTVRLADLDEHLRAVHGEGLEAVLGPLRDRPGDRAREALGRDAVLARCWSSASRRPGELWGSG